jgi:type 1 fimbriae regulatory protein FimE
MYAQVIEFPSTGREIAEPSSPPRRRRNAEVRTREYLTADEVERMLAAVRKVRGRLAVRDELLILIAYRHALRASEITRLRWEQVDLRAGLLHVTRMKNGTPSTHPIRGPELRALRAWKREQGEGQPYVFTSLRGGPMTPRTVHYVVAKAGRDAGLPFSTHPHALRHSTGFELAARGQDTRAIQLYLGHRQIQNTTRYTSLSPQRFQNFWND